MKKLRLLLTTWVLLFVFAFGGCGEKKEASGDMNMDFAVDPGEEVSIDDKEIFSDDLMPLDKDELSELDNPDMGDDSFTVGDESEADSGEYEVGIQ